MQITKQLRTETGHRLTNYVGRCAHLHGHSYLWEVTAHAYLLDDKNMVMDFKDLKKAMNTVLDPLDHCLVLAPDDPLWEFDADSGDGVLEKVLHPTNDKEAKPRLIKWHENPTAESFAKWALEQIHKTLLNMYLKDSSMEDGSMPYVSAVSRSGKRLPVTQKRRRRTYERNVYDHNQQNTVNGCNPGSGSGTGNRYRSSQRIRCPADPL